MKTHDVVAEILTRVGNHVSEKSIHMGNAALNYLDTGRRFKDRGLHASPRLADRYSVLDRAFDELADVETLYLEFSVYTGESMQYTSGHLRNPSSQLIGFDSFEGLPEFWVRGSGVGHFSTGGITPIIDDRRVSFVVGWFDETLPAFVPPEHDALLVIVDCDLYSSTTTVLRFLEPHVSVGSFLYFDDFSDRLNEARSFFEFEDRTRFGFELVAATHTLTHVLFRRMS